MPATTRRRLLAGTGRNFSFPARPISYSILFISTALISALLLSPLLSLGLLSTTKLLKELLVTRLPAGEAGYSLLITRRIC